jgi:hypothetical protein
MMVAVPSVSPPEQEPLVVIVTGRLESAVAATLNVLPKDAEAGEGVVTVIVWLVGPAAPTFCVMKASLFWKLPPDPR